MRLRSGRLIPIRSIRILIDAGRALVIRCAQLAIKWAGLRSLRSFASSSFQPAERGRLSRGQVIAAKRRTMKDAHTNLSVLLGYVLLLSMFYSSPTTAATSQQTGADGRGVTVTEQNNGQTVAVSMHDTLVVWLQTQMGTGHGWHILKTNARRLNILSGPDLERADG